MTPRKPAAGDRFVVTSGGALGVWDDKVGFTGTVAWAYGREDEWLGVVYDPPVKPNPNDPDGCYGIRSNLIAVTTRVDDPT
jgi:hypothetical protein